ncbi:MAG: hypothetical protein QNJ72_10380 [Pleurocapsa sp. MO_226.B13]|nr:hypothetical protein [Pleurocapsa sp. MO_226.B13]
MTQPISIEPQELETWLDEFMAKQMEKLHIPGVTFSLMQNGELLLADYRQTDAATAIYSRLSFGWMVLGFWRIFC